jgi:[acyl-carrier-protein] S-malonyltransferase
MSPAVAELAAVASRVSAADPATALLSNADGTVVRDGQGALARLVNQVSNPVRWDLCSTTLLDLGVTGLLELPPAGTLTGLAKRGLKGVETVALKTPDDLDTARALLAAHGTATVSTSTGGAA